MQGAVQGQRGASQLPGVQLALVVRAALLVFPLSGSRRPPHAQLDCALSGRSVPPSALRSHRQLAEVNQNLSRSLFPLALLLYMPATRVTFVFTFLRLRLRLVLVLVFIFTVWQWRRKRGTVGRERRSGAPEPPARPTPPRPTESGAQAGRVVRSRSVTKRGA